MAGDFATGFGMAMQLENLDLQKAAAARAEAAQVRQLLKDTSAQMGTLIAEAPEEQRGAVVNSAMRIIEQKTGTKLNPLLKDLFKKDPLGFFEKVSMAADSAGDELSMGKLKGILSTEELFLPLAVGMHKAVQQRNFRDIALGSTQGTQPSSAAAGGDTATVTVPAGVSDATAEGIGAPWAARSAQPAPAAGGTGGGAVPSIVKGQIKREQALGSQLADLERRQEFLVKAGGAGSKEMDFLKQRIDAVKKDIDNLTSNELRAMIAARGGNLNAPTTEDIIGAQESLIELKGRTAEAESRGRTSGQIDAEYNKPLPLDFVAQHRLQPGITLRQLIDQSRGGAQGSGTPPAAGAPSAPPATTASGAAPAAGGGAGTPAPGANILRSPEAIKRGEAENAALGKFQGERFEELVKAGSAATEEKSRLQLISRLLPQIRTGKLVGPAQEIFYQVAQGYGYDSNKLGVLETFNSITADLTSKMVKRLPGALSEKELSFIEQIPPSVRKSPAANAAIIEMMTKVADRQEIVSRRAQQWVQKYGTLTTAAPTGKDFWGTLSEYTEKNPLLGAEMRNPIFAPPRGASTREVSGKIIQ